jgi:hypothetical protein
MNYFEQDKADKLKRLVALRIMNALGMIAWRERHSCAEQKIRMLHPLNWVYVPCMFVAMGVIYGLLEVYKEGKNLIRNDCVWW